jgi:biotin carboxylase
LNIRPAFIFIESNTSGTGEIFLREAATLGFTPVLLSAEPSRYGFLARGCEAITLDTSSHAETADAIRKVQSSWVVAGVYSSSDYFVPAAARIARSFGLCGENPDCLSRVRNKIWQRQALEAAGLAVPRYRRIATLEELARFIDEVPLPVVMKPTEGTGSVGVRLCRTTAEAFLHCEMLLNNPINERGSARPREVVAETFLEGTEFSAEMFGETLVGITRKYLGAQPYFVEMGHDYPAQMTDSQQQQVSRVCRVARAALGLPWGPAHIEFRWTNAGPIVVEYNARLAGGLIPVLVRLASGVNLIGATIRLAAGLRFDLDRIHQRVASIRFITLPRSGQVQRVQYGNALAVEGIVDAKVQLSEGDIVRVRHDFRDRVGYVIGAGDHRAAVTRAVDEASKSIVVSVGGDSGMDAEGGP